MPRKSSLARRRGRDRHSSHVSHRWGFDSIGEFAAHVRDLHARRVYSDDASRSATSNRASSDWDLGIGFEGALSMAESGGYWREGAEGMHPVDLDVGQLATDHDFDVPAFEPDVQGFAPLVPDYLAGSPECMLAMHDHPTPNKLVRIGLSVVHSSCTSASAIRNRGMALLSVVDALQLLGYACEIWAVYRTDGGTRDCRPSIEVCVKQAGDNWDPASVAYALTHPGFARRLGFRFCEAYSECDGVNSCGYGGAVTNYDDFDVGFPYMLGDFGYETRETATATVLNHVIDSVKRMETRAAA